MLRFLVVLSSTVGVSEGWSSPSKVMASGLASPTGMRLGAGVEGVWSAALIQLWFLCVTPRRPRAIVMTQEVVGTDDEAVVRALSVTLERVGQKLE